MLQQHPITLQILQPLLQASVLFWQFEHFIILIIEQNYFGIPIYKLNF